MQAATSVYVQKCRQVRIAQYIDQEYNQHERENTARDFERQPRPLPAPPLPVVENGLAFRHQDNPS